MALMLSLYSGFILMMDTSEAKKESIKLFEALPGS